MWCRSLLLGCKRSALRCRAARRWAVAEGGGLAALMDSTNKFTVKHNIHREYTRVYSLEYPHQPDTTPQTTHTHHVADQKKTLQMTDDHPRTRPGDRFVYAHQLKKLQKY